MSRGSFWTSPGSLHLEGMCPGSTLTLDVVQDGVVHRLDYRAWRDDLVERTYWVGRQRMFWGREANSFEARLLPEVVRRLQDGN